MKKRLTDEEVVALSKRVRDLEVRLAALEMMLQLAMTGYRPESEHNADPDPDPDQDPEIKKVVML